MRAAAIDGALRFFEGGGFEGGRVRTQDVLRFFEGGGFEGGWSCQDTRCIILLWQRGYLFKLCCDLL